MKKLFLLSALAMGAMTMSAQLELIGTVNFPADQLTDNNYEHCIYNTTNRPPFQYYATTDTTATTVTVHLFEYATLNEVKSVTLNRTVVKPSQYGYAAYALFIYKNFWANDNKIYFLLEDGTKEDWNLNLYCEDGNLIKNFNAPGSVYLVNTNIGYLLLEEIGDDKNPQTKVYQIPGTGQPTDLESPTAPARTSNARKVVENGQMYIILDGVKYAVTGTEL